MDRYRDWAAVLLIAGLLALNYPLLALADRAVTVAGLPLLYFYLFAVWLALIVGLALLLGKRPGR